MNTNTLIELKKYGQSVWLDNISRKLLTSGELERLVKEDGISGVTSNPTIFDKAISGSADYDEALIKLASKNISSKDIFEAIAIEDIRNACELLLPVFNSTGGDDGYVSIEVSPKLAYNTEATILEARRLAAAVDKKNLLVKVPGTNEGLPAIEALIGEGININITLLFSLRMYGKVIDAYLSGLEKLAREGKPLGTMFSVASFFVSRVDTAVDKLLQEKAAGETFPKRVEKLQSMMGKVAIANARIAYQMFKEAFDSSRFKNLEEKGAKVQKLLWASTSTKNPAYRDILYAEELIGPDTIDTMPQSTITAFRVHGRVRLTLEENVEEASRIIGEDLKEMGIDLEQVTDKVSADGVKAFEDSYDALLRSVENKIKQVAV